MPSSEDLIRRARQTQKEITTEEVAEQLKKIVLIDVRESDEHRGGAIPGAVLLPRGFLELRIETAVPKRDAPIVLYCAGGSRSILAAETLSRMGYTNAQSMQGGFTKWVAEGRPTDKPSLLSAAERRRYARHLAIPEVGEAGQRKLLQSKVLIVGAGGLGSPAAYYLTAAGVGTIGMVDSDVVDETNLQRQILHSSDRVGMSKIESAGKTLRSLNPALHFIAFEERLTDANVERILPDFDIVIDGSDNFPTRYLINDACWRLEKPYVHGSVFRFEGQVSVFDPNQSGPCYRCLYPEPPPPSVSPSCAQAGVLGVLPGVIGLLQAVETLKLLLGIGESLIGRLLTYDALGERFREFALHRNPDCPHGECRKSSPRKKDFRKPFFSTPGKQPVS